MRRIRESDRGAPAPRADGFPAGSATASGKNQSQWSLAAHTSVVYCVLPRLHDLRGTRNWNGSGNRRLLFYFLNRQLVDKTMQVSPRDSQHSRTFGLAPSALAQRSEYKSALEVANFFLVGAREQRHVAAGAQRGW